METHRTQGSPTAAHFSQTVRATFLVSVCSVAIIAVGSGKPIEAAQQSDATELIETTGFDSQTFVITAPSVTAAITPLTATVPLNGTTQFIAYAVGNINNAITVQVNGVAGGSTSTGTITHTAAQLPGIYLYTAPATMPMSGNTVTITVISQADPSKTASSTITLQ